MLKRNRLFPLAPFWYCIMVLAWPIAAQDLDLLTQRYDNSRSGVNLNETKLTTSNVNNATFGKLAFRNLDGNPYERPLILFN